MIISSTNKNTILLFALTVWLIVNVAHPTFAQKKLYGIEKKELQKKLLIADELLEKHSYYNAIGFYQDVLKGVPQNEYVLFKLGKAYYKSRDYTNSELYLGKIFDWKKEKTTYPTALFYYAHSLKNNRKYDEAKRAFLTFLKTRGRTKEESYFKSLAKNEIQSCDFAQQMYVFDTVNNINIKALVGDVNKAYSDFAPIKMGNDTLLFSSIRADSVITELYESEEVHPVKIYQSIREGSEWGEVEEFKKVNHFYDNTANGVFSTDRKKFYFTRCRPNKNLVQVCSIYFTELKNGSWSKPKKVGSQVNHPGYSSTQPTLSTMTKTTGKKKKEYPVLYFSSNRPGSKGGFDIYYSIMNDKGDFGKAVNCGPRINSLGDEITPCYDEITKSLYFSSNYHSGAGGFDVFKCEGNQGKWGKLQNMGFPVNSSFDDSYYFPPSQLTTGFLVTNRPGGTALKSETCCDDIYEVEKIYPPLQIAKGIVKPENKIKGDVLENVWVGLIPTGKIKSHLKTYKSIKYLKDSIAWISRTDNTGMFNFSTLKTKGYSVVFAKDSFELKIAALDSILSSSKKDLLPEILLADLKDSEAIALNIDPNKLSTKKEAELEYGIPQAFNSAIMEEAIEGDVFLLEKVNFETNKDILSKDALPALDLLYRFLKEKSTLKVEISGHTDNQGSEKYNQELSQRRANYIKDYLVKKGISKKRIISIGYGESMPLVPNENPDGADNPEGRRVNRRTEVKILEE